MGLSALALAPLTSVPAHAQQREWSFERLAQGRGLSNGTVTSIAQDRHGFLWLGTADGLNRYDGTAFTLFRPVEGDSTSLAHGWITSIAAGRDGGLWVGTLRGGVHQLLPGHAGFRRHRHVPADSTTLSSDEVNTVRETRDGTVWVGTVRGLDRLDPRTGRVRRWRPAPDSATSFLNDVLSLAEDDRGGLWVGTRAGLLRFDASTGEFRRLPLTFRTAIVRQVLRDRRGVVWVGTEDELLELDGVTGMVRARHGGESSTRDALFGGRVLALAAAPDGTIWIGSDDGLTALDPVRGTARRLRQEARDARSLGGKIVRSVLVDRGGVLWVGLENFGVSKHAPSVVQFDALRHDPLVPNTLSDGYIRGMLEDRAGVIWIGTQYGGLNRLDRRSGRITAYRHRADDPGGLPGDEVWAVLEDRAGTMWVGLHRGGLGTFDRRTGRFSRFAGVPRDISVNVLYEDRAGALLVGLEGRGLVEISRDRRRVRTWGATAGDAQVLAHDDVQAILEDRHGLLWVGGVGGLTRLDRRTGWVRTTRAAPDVPGALRSDFVTNIVEDSRGTVWVATKGGGLSRYDRAGDRFETIGAAEGLPSDFVYGVIEDARGRLWLSTENGIAMYDPRNGQITNYGLDDGLQAREFNRRAFLRTRDGAIHFGGINGVNVFRPDAVPASRPLPPVSLLALQGGDASPMFAVGLTPDSVVRFGPGENNLRMSFAALEYSAPEKIRYLYRLRGVDRDWVEAGPRRDASYGGLPPGVYVFEVKAANAAGVWTPQVSGVTIEIAPPWTGTWWARTLGVLALFGIPAAAVRVRLLAVRRRSALLEHRVNEQTRDLRAAQEQLSAALEREREAARELADITAAVPGAVFQLRESAHGRLDFPFVSDGIARLGEGLFAGGAQSGEDAAAAFLFGVYPGGEAGVRRALAAASTAGEPWRAEWAWAPPAGETRWASVQARPSRAREGTTVWTGVLVDTTATRRVETERAALERTMLEAQKAESLAVLAGGVAHDFNNLLVGVLAGADLLKQEVPPGGDAADTLANIRTAAQRAAELTQQMLAYAGKGKFVVLRADLAGIVREMLALLRTAVPRSVVFEVHADPAPVPVEADVTQIRQVVMNLVTNASEAVGHRAGRVTVRVGVEAAPRDRLSLMHASPDMAAEGPYALLEVADNGAGMEPAVLARIFDPFYTTKFTGRGLGLAAVQGIVRAHRGGMHVTSVPGRGTTFRIYLPLATAASAPAAESLAVTADPGPGRGGRILVVDDEDVVRRATERMVRRFGYDAVTAADGAEALERLAAGSPVDLVLMDVTMPVMDGPTAAREMRARGFAGPILLFSGYAAEALAARGMMTDADGFLTKPFQMAELAATIRTLLAEPVRAGT